MTHEAANSITRFDSHDWIGDVDVPTAVIRTDRDRLVDPANQTELVTMIRKARLVEHDDGHIACSRSTFVAPMMTACRDVAWRAGG